MKKNAPTAQNSSTTEEQIIEELAQSGFEAESRTDSTSAQGGELTPVESAILCMDKQLSSGMMLIREIKNQTAMLETAFKLMSYELSVISKNLSKKE